MSLRTVRGQFLSGLFLRTLPGKKRLLGHPILFNRARVYVPTSAASVRVPQMFHRQRAVAVGAFRHVPTSGATRRFSSFCDHFVKLFCHAFIPCNNFWNLARVPPRVPPRVIGCCGGHFNNQRAMLPRQIRGRCRCLSAQPPEGRRRGGGVLGPLGPERGFFL